MDQQATDTLRRQVESSIKNIQESQNLLEIQEAKYQKLESLNMILEKINYNLQLQLQKVLNSSPKSEILEQFKENSTQLLILSREFNEYKNSTLEILDTLREKQEKFTTEFTKKEISSLEKINELNIQLKDLKVQNSSKEEEYSLKELEISKLKFEISANSKSMEEISSKVQEKCKTEQELKIKVQELVQENQKLQENIQNLKEKTCLEISKEKKVVKDLQDKIQSLNDKNSKINKGLKEKDVLVKDLEEENSELKIIVNSLQDKLKEKIAQNSLVEEKLKKSLEKNHAQDVEVDNLSLEKLSLTEKVQELQTKFKKSLEAKDVQAREVLELKSLLKKSRESKDLQGKNQKEMQTELKDLHKVYENKVKELELLLDETHNANQKKLKEFEEYQAKKMQDYRTTSQKELEETRKIHRKELEDNRRISQKELEESHKINDKKVRELEEKHQIKEKKLEDINKVYEKKVDELQRKLSESQDSKENVLRDMDLLVNELKALKEKLDIFKRAETMGLRAHEQLEKSSTSYLQHNDELKLCNQNLETQISLQRADLSSAQEEIESLVVREDEFKKSIRKLKCENQNLVSKLEKSDAAYEKFKTDNDILVQDLARLKTEITGKESALKTKQNELHILEQRCFYAESELKSILPRYSSLKDKLDFVLTHNSEVENELLRAKTELNLLKPEKFDQDLKSENVLGDKLNDPFEEKSIIIQDQPIKRKKSNSIFEKLSSFKKSFGSAATLNDSTSDTELLNEFKRLSSFVDVNDKTPKDVIDAVLKKMANWNSKISSLNLELQERDDFVREQSKKLQLLERLAI